jgi:uncharacterized protein (TIGR03083 family)
VSESTENTVERAKRAMEVLGNSHDRLMGVLADLEPGRLTGPSYDDDWTIAQVLSHLGSGAEIFSLWIDAGVAGAEPPGPDLFPAIWDTWNAKSPEQQEEDLRGADAGLMEQLRSLDDAQLAAFHLAMFGMDLDAPELIGMRVSEHALHTWDVAVELDPEALLLPDAVELLVDKLPARIARAAKPVAEPIRLLIETTEPKRAFVLSVGDDTVSAEEAPDPTDRDEASAKLSITSEALVRLVAGRLDPEHTPSDTIVDGVSLETLREVFPGY